jgi:hypothetical protein
LTVKGAASQTANLLEVKDSAGSVLSVINENGNLGIGNSSPMYQIDVRDAADPVIAVTDTTNGLKFGMSANDTTASLNVDWDNTSPSSALKISIDGSEKMRVTDTGYVGIGTLVPTEKLHVHDDSGQLYAARITNAEATAANVSNSRNGMYVTATDNVSSGFTNSGFVEGLWSQASNTGVGTLDSAYGLTGKASNTSSGILTTGIGVFASVNNASSGSITNAKALDIDVTKGGGTINNVYGLHVRDLVQGSVSTHAIYQSGADDDNFFAGKIGIGTTSPVAMLEVNGQFATTLPSPMLPTGTTQSVDLNLGNGQVLDLGSATGDVTLSLSNPVAGGSYTIKIIQSATSRTIIWPGTVKWPGGVPITLSKVDDAIDLVTFFYDGTNFLAAGGVNYQ